MATGRRNPGIGKKGEGQREYPNETLRLLIERASCRDFSDRSIPEEVLEHILEDEHRHHKILMQVIGEL